MKFLETLHKLGILRLGTTGGTYKSYEDMPDELMFDNVYDKKKDLVSRQAATPDAGKKNPKKLSGLLFWVLVFAATIIALFFSLMIGTGVWFYLVIISLLFFLFILFRFKSGACLLRSIWLAFFVYLIVSIIFVLFGVSANRPPSANAPLTNTSKESAATEQAQDQGGQSQVASPSDNIEWIDYTGSKSSLLTFRYPKQYTLEEYGTSIIVYVDKSKDYDYHFTVSVMDFELDQPKDCAIIAKAVVDSKPGSEVRYAKPFTIGDSTGCDYGINIMQEGKKIYEIHHSFNGQGKNYGLTAYAMQESDLDILRQVMDTFRLK